MSCGYRNKCLDQIGEVCEKCVKEDTLFNLTGDDVCEVLDIKCNQEKRTLIVQNKIKCPINLWTRPEDI